MSYLSDSGETLHVDVHDHPSDRRCHWVNVFKPLAFIVFRDAQFMQVAQGQKCGFDAFDRDGYAKWLWQTRYDGLLNLLNMFLMAVQIRGLPVICEVS